MYIETGRLLLREFTENDLDALFLIYSDREANTFLPWFPLESREQAKQLFQEKYAAASGEEGNGCRYAVCLKSDNVPIGYVHASGDDSHDFGYALRKEFWGKGIATEAAKAVLERLKEKNFGYITATHDVKNPRSGEVMKRLGMTYCYSYVEQWQPKNIPVTFRMYQLNFDGSQWVYRKYWDTYEKHFVEEVL